MLLATMLLARRRLPRRAMRAHRPLPRSRGSAGDGPGRRVNTARRAYAPLAAVVAILVLFQAVLAGRSLFGSWSITVHGVVGNATFALAALLAVIAGVGRAGRHAVGAAVALTLVLTAQIGFGYAGRDSIEAAAWHIANGVLAVGLAVHQLTLAWSTHRTASSGWIQAQRTGQR